MKSFVLRTALGGLLVVLPMTFVAIVLTRAIAAIRAALEPVTAALHFAPLFPGLWAVLALVVVCFIAGLILKLPSLRGVLTAARLALARRFPFYAHLRSLEEGFLEESGHRRIQAALVELNDTMVLAFVGEELPDGRYVVFVPGSPNARDGNAYILTRERVHLIDADARHVLHCVRRWGIGTGELIKTMRRAV